MKSKFPLSLLLAITSLLLTVSYIGWKEWGVRKNSDAMSDEGIVPVDQSVADGAFIARSYNIPKSLEFAGERVPLEITDVKERLDKELQINIYLHSNTIFLIKRASRWFPLMEPILKRNGIPEDFKYLPLIESNLLNVVSPKEAAGFWQILKTSGKEYGLEITDEVDERYHVAKATEAACKYLKQSYAKFGNWSLVAASYNRGMGGISRSLSEQKVTTYYDLHLGDETSRYLFRLLAIREIIENPEKYGFVISEDHLYRPEKTREIKVTSSIKSLVEFAHTQNSNYKFLKRHNPWLRDDKLTVKSGREYIITLPE